MADYNRIEDLANATAVDVDGEKVGAVKDVYVNDTTGQPDFVSVDAGFGSGDSIVPLRGHTLRDGELRLAFPKERINDAPDLDENGHLTTEDQEAFYRHYGLTETQDVTTYETNQRGAAPAAGAAAGAGYAAGERVETDRAEAPRDENGEIIRSEEQLNVSKDRVETGQVNLRKYVVNETETVEVPVEREEVRVVREPITDADRANYDGNIGEQEASVTLHEDRVNVSKESVPVEKVSLEKDTVQDTERVSEEVRKERFETDGIVEGEAGRDIRDNR
ncbi:photosystem reaction center subunit H [Corynebacterium sp. BCW_4722]|nr:photosystem reaction center subunit H [Corynebacterium sp. BCW_4722]